MAHLLFLSHAGADTERALHLATAIEASPDAQAVGLEVWLDKRPDGPHRLQAGTPWQDQLERAIVSSAPVRSTPSSPSSPTTRPTSPTCHVSSTSSIGPGDPRWRTPR